ncbi:PIR protein [Plasmodium ovale]|uniref:PIR protein n=1 Tax=Plasmodium ovale TaxID=36330 RepID=A0A1D3KWI6_PLAOA|nr:PIR protein [Plasmodium ovale]
MFNNKKHCQDKNCCQYINHFLNKTVHTDYNSDKTIFDIYITYINHKKNDTIRNICFSEINYMGANKYQKVEKLYTVYNLYKIFNSHQRKTSLYHSAKACVSAYNDILTIHPELYDSKFCKVLKDLKSKLESNDLISTTKCGAESPYLILYPESCTLLLAKLEQIVSPSHSQTDQIEAQVKPGEKSDRQEEHLIGDTQEKITISSSSLDATLLITLFSSGVGALLILLYFYKFTPFGHWLRLRTQGFKGNSKHSDGKEYEMHQHNSEYDEINAEYNIYNISYNSL